MNWDTMSNIPASSYQEGSSTVPDGDISRVAYCVELNNKWVWTSFDHTDRSQVGIPVDYKIDGNVANLNVYDSQGKSVTGSAGGKLEFWDECYGTSGGDSGNYDHDDSPSGANCYGSMQVHDGTQTEFGFNGWSHGGYCDITIGTNTLSTHKDGTFNQQCNNYQSGDSRSINTYVLMSTPVTTAQLHLSAASTTPFTSLDGTNADWSAAHQPPVENDGTFAYFNLDNTAFSYLQTHNPVTIGQYYTSAAWVNWRSSDSGWRTLFRNSDDHEVLVQSGAKTLGLYLTRNGVFRCCGDTIDVGSWQLVVVTGAGDSATSTTGVSTFFVGSLSESPTSVGTADRVTCGTQTYQFGHGGQGPGHVAEFYRWDKVLSLSEIQSLWSETNPTTTVSTAPAVVAPAVDCVGAWSLNYCGTMVSPYTWTRDTCNNGAGCTGPQTYTHSISKSGAGIDCPAADGATRLNKKTGMTCHANCVGAWAPKSMWCSCCNAENTHLW